MNDIQQTRHLLWHSLDMSWVKRNFIMLMVVAVLFGFIKGADIAAEPWIFPLILGLVEGPILGFLLYRTWKIFRRTDRYIFCETVLDTPFGGWLRDTIRFTVTVNDSEGRSHRVDTHGIFATRSIFGPNLEDYVNRKVRVAYNEETGTLVVIG